VSNAGLLSLGDPSAGETGGVGSGLRLIVERAGDSGTDISSGSWIRWSSGISICKKYKELWTSSALTTFSRGFRGVKKTS
jgi:hypothetical protein